MNVISIDPGSKKCGMVLAEISSLSITEAKVVSFSHVIKLIKIWEEKVKIDFLILGNGTGSKYWQDEISNTTNLKVKLIDERNTTLRARERYWEIWPKKYYLKFIPNGLLIPRENLDALAALILLEDHIKLKFTWKTYKDFKIWP